jgi:Skp family chaperone for outer membrane proteins
MNTRIVATITVLTAVTAAAAFAQSQTAPKVTKADVEKLIEEIKKDKTKFGQYCEITKLEVQSDALAQKNQNDPKLDELEKEMEDLATKLGPDYQRVTGSELDEASVALFDDLAKSCNVGFEPAKAGPKATKAEVQKVDDGIKNDPQKLAKFCEMTKLINQAGALAQQGKSDDPKLQSLETQIDDIAAALGPDYERISTSDLDEASSAPLSDLSKSCK